MINLESSAAEPKVDPSHPVEMEVDDNTDTKVPRVSPIDKTRDVKPAVVPADALPENRKDSFSVKTGSPERNIHGKEDPVDQSAMSSSKSSSASDVHRDVPGDEIVVGTNLHAAAADGKRSLEAPVSEEQEQKDKKMVDAEDTQPTVGPYPKRKRTSVYDNLGEDKLEGGLLLGADDGRRSSIPPPAKQRHGMGGVKGVLLGHWRDSPVPVERGKHAVVGFMDVRDRLRTRIQNVTRTGEAINTRLFPIPPGPGGSWVTFERVVFLDHLVGRDHNEIKEYVKLRSDAHDEPPEVKSDNDLKAVREAIKRVKENPLPENALTPAIAYGADIPAEAQLNHRADKRRRTSGNEVARAGSITGSVISQSSQQQSQQLPENLPGTRPTRILVGCWSKSEFPRDEDKHAVYGILGANDMFRVKLVRETMDGRFCDGNFPTGAGALWIAYEEVTFLRHLNGLTRPEMKEYCRVRQAQIDAGEREGDRIPNETKAVYEAQQRAAMNSKSTTGTSGTTGARHSAHSTDDADISPNPEPAHELRRSRREVPSLDGRPPRHSYSEADMRHGSRQPSMDDLARHEVIKMEQAQMHQDRHHRQSMMGAGSPYPNGNRAAFDDNIGRMQKVWAAQEAERAQNQQQGMPAMQPVSASMGDDVKVYMGMRYERKQNGPFAGKLVSSGTLISIDGEDYVEYKVLTKPM